MANNNQIVRRLKRELVANPAKAAVLGVLLLVAVWFWIPLIVGKSKPTAPGASSETVANGGSVAGGESSVAMQSVDNPTTTLPQTNKNPLKWKQAVEAIRRDPSMQPAVPLASSRDPFRRDESKARDAEALAAATAAQQKMTPAQVGIQLNSTAVGPRKRTALIGGKAYQEGDTVRGSKGHGSFKLVEIRRQSVVLEQGGTQFQVWMPRAEPVHFED